MEQNSERGSLLQQRLNQLYSEIGSATLVAVSKSATVDDIKICYELGHRDFGENRIQQLKERADQLEKACPEIRWHMIGNIQSNKINQLLKVPNLFYIHSVSSIKLLRMFLEKDLPRKINFFLQVNTSGEEEKSGFESITDLTLAKNEIESRANKNFKLQGLMTIGTIRTNEFEQEAKKCFQQMMELKQELSMDNLKLSMGMSQDYALALSYGADYVRVGGKIFAS